LPKCVKVAKGWEIVLTEVINAGSASDLPLGLRERNKAEKLRRLRDAARTLFIKQGYDETTMRSIAERADIGFGTLFTYASDKRDLLFLIFNDNLDETADAAFKHATAKRIFLEQLIAYFENFYRFFLPQPELSRLVLREMTFYVKGHQAEQFRDGVSRIYHHLASLAETAQTSGTLGTSEQPVILAQALMATFSQEIRRWIATDDPDLSKGLARLRRMLALQISGLQPREGALGRR
jgi:AcrR family transcriptional regulator